MKSLHFLSRNVPAFGALKASTAPCSMITHAPPLQPHLPRTVLPQLRTTTPRPIPRSFKLPHIHSRRYTRKSTQHPSHPNPTPNLNSPAPQSFTTRLKKLSREYGYTVIGVYLALTVADFPFCLLAVRLIGTERVAHVEHLVVGGAKGALERYFPDFFSARSSEESAEAVAEEEAAVLENEEREEEEAGGATIWTQLALAFVIHKSFIFIRVPLTAAITPKVVKTLRSRGWNIGKRRPKTAVR